MTARIFLALALLAALVPQQADAFMSGDTRGGVRNVWIYADSLWIWTGGCPCDSLAAEGWGVRNTSVTGTTVWFSTNCVGPYPNSGACLNIADQFIERTGSLCGRVANLDGVDPLDPTCARQGFGPLDVVVIQIGANDVRRGWVQSDRLETFVKPAWIAILDEAEALSIPVVVVHTIPILANHVEGQPGPAGDDWITENEQLREIYSWLHDVELPTRSNVVEVDAFAAFLHFEEVFGASALLGLYVNCPVKGTTSLDDDCVHPGGTPNAAGKSGVEVLGEAVRNGVYRATSLRRGM